MTRESNLLQQPSPRAAVLVRLAAFAMAVVTFVLVLIAVASAIGGHGDAARSGVIAAIALALTSITTLAARRTDPLRR